MYVFGVYIMCNITKKSSGTKDIGSVNIKLTVKTRLIPALVQIAGRRIRRSNLGYTPAFAYTPWYIIQNKSSLKARKPLRENEIMKISRATRTKNNFVNATDNILFKFSLILCCELCFV